MIWLLSGTAALSILVSALCSASETTTFAITTSRLRTMEEEGFRGAIALAELRTRADQTRAALLFFNTLFNTVAVGTVVLLGHALYGTLGGALGLLAGSLAVLILGQGIPRLLASRRPVRFALASAPAVLSVVKGLAAATGPVRKLAVGVVRTNGAEGRVRKNATSVNSHSWGRRRGWSGKTSTC